MKISINKLLYNCGYVAILIAFLITVTTLTNTYEWINSVTRYLRIFGYFCLVSKIVLNNSLSRKRIQILAIIISGAFVASVISGTQMLLTDILVMLAAYKIDKLKIVKLDLFIRIVFLFIVLFLFSEDLIPQMIDYRDWGLPRFSLGFGHPNRLSLHLFMICMYMYYVYHEKHKCVLCVMYIVTLAILMTVTDGRTSAIGVMTLAVLTIFEKRSFFPKIKASVFKYSNMILFMSVGVSLVLPALYMLGIIPHLNTTNTLYSRIYLSARGIIENGLTLFGQRIESISTLEAQRLGIHATAIDNAYVFTMINYGVVSLIALVLLLYYSMKQAKNIHDFYALVCMTILVIIAILEAQVIYIESNVFLLFACDMFYRKQDGALK